MVPAGRTCSRWATEVKIGSLGEVGEAMGRTSGKPSGSLGGRTVTPATLFTVEMEELEEASEGILGINARSAALETR